MTSDQNRRVLVIDDNEAIHTDFQKILQSNNQLEAVLEEAEDAFFAPTSNPAVSKTLFELEFALQGREGVEKVRLACDRDEPFSIAFVDMRMPPGWDGLETIVHLWQLDPRIQVVICTAYSDHSWSDIVSQVGETDRLLILKKPFDPIEVRQLCASLSEKWRAERRADYKVKDLRAMVDERTSEIVRAQSRLAVKNKELTQARIAAEHASRAKSEFLANMSHEMRTPMTAIVGYADILMNSGEIHLDQEEQDEALESIQKNCGHLLNLINEILDLAKVESGKMEAEQRLVSVVDIGEDILRLLSGRAKSKHLKLEVSRQEGLPDFLRSDPKRLTQILINLVGNAIKFTEAGSIRLVISPSTISNERIVFSVIDTGIGLDHLQIRRVFEPFVQADTSTTRRFGGTGLGLALSVKLAELLGGEIRVSSVLGEGSTFSLEIPHAPEGSGPLVQPARQLEQLRPLQPALPEQPELPVPTPLECRILLVDDVKTNRMLIAMILRKAGAEVEQAENGQIAIEKIELAQNTGCPFDVILMDMQMPVLDGYEATRRLRAAGLTTPIVALTAHAMTGDSDTCLEAGCSDYMSKPVDRKKLLRTIYNYIKDR